MLLTEGPSRYFVPIMHDARRSPLLCFGGPRGYVERTREEAEERPVVFVEDLEREGRST